MSALVPLIVGGVYFAAPLLAPADDAAAAQLSASVERARRLLVQYGANEERISGILSQLAAYDVDVNLEGDDAQEIFEEHREFIEQAEEVLKDRFSGRTAIARRELEERFKTAGGVADQPLTPSTKLGGNAGSMANAAREGIRVRDRLFQQNKGILAEALREIDQGLRDHTLEKAHGISAEANRLKGAIVVAMATAAERQADLDRSMADGHRRRLVRLAARIAEVDPQRDLVQDSGIHEKIETLRADVEVVRQNITDAADRLRVLDAAISGLTLQSKDAKNRADAARGEMDRLSEEGVDLLDPDGFETFRDAFEAASVRYRTALAEAHRLEHGHLAGARIDDSGDFVTGEYVPVDDDVEIRRERGIKDYRDERETLAFDLEGLERQASDLEAAVKGFELLAEEYARRAGDARSESQSLQSEAASTFAEFEQRVTDADASMDSAARKIASAVSAYRTAARAVGDVSRAAQDRLSLASPAQQDASPLKNLTKDKWRTGQINNELAQARVALAVMHTKRFLHASADYSLVVFAKEAFQLSEADPSVFAERRDEARESAMEEARSAASDFERSARELGTSWTVPAQAAAAHELLAILEDPAHRATAIANYANAIETRDDWPAVQSLVNRLAQLRN